MVDQLQDLKSRGLKRISMTTNASRMAPVASRLVQAGIDDFNVSLDAIDGDTFAAHDRPRHRAGVEVASKRCRTPAPR